MFRPASGRPRHAAAPGRVRPPSGFSWRGLLASGIVLSLGRYRRSCTSERENTAGIFAGFELRFQVNSEERTLGKCATTQTLRSGGRTGHPVVSFTCQRHVVRTCPKSNKASSSAGAPGSGGSGGSGTAWTGKRPRPSGASRAGPAALGQPRHKRPRGLARRKHPGLLPLPHTEVEPRAAPEDAAELPPTAGDWTAPADARGQADDCGPSWPHWRRDR